MNQNNILTIFIIFIIFVFKLFIILNSSITFYSDDAIYAQLAKFFFQGDFSHAFHPTWPPLFPFLSSLLYPISQNWELSLRLVSVLSGSLLAIPIYLLASRLMSKIHAYLFIILMSFTTPIFSASITPLSDMLATTLAISCLISVFFALKKGNRNLFILGSFFAGLTFLTRAEGTMLFGLSLIYLVVYFSARVLQHKLSIEHAFTTTALFVFTFILTTSPYVISIRNQLDTWTLSQKFSAQIQQEHAFKIRENLTTWAQDITSIRSPNYNSPYFFNGQKYILKNIYWLTEWFFQKLQGWKEALLKNFPIWSLVFISIGLIPLLKKHFLWSTGYLIFFSFISVPTTVFSTSIWDIRYLLWVLPFLLLLFYHGVYILVEKILPLFKKHIISLNTRNAVIIPTLSLFMLPVISLTPLLQPLDYTKRITKSQYVEEIKLASFWIKNHTDQTIPKIMARHEAFEFYAEGETIYLPQEISYEELIKYAIRLKTDYIIVWNQEISERDSMAFLLTLPQQSQELERVASFPDNENTITIYKLKKSYE